MRDYNNIMTTEDVAAYLKVQVQVVRRWTRRGMIKGYKLAGIGNYRYFKHDIIKFLLGEEK